MVRDDRSMTRDDEGVSQRKLDVCQGVACWVALMRWNSRVLNIVIFSIMGLATLLGRMTVRLG